jgi:fatty-acyl-CoA synthase
MDTALSYDIGPSDKKLIYRTIGAQLDLAADTWPGVEAMVDREHGVRLSFARLREQADQLAAGFLRLGLSVGDRIGIWSPNRAEWVLTQFAAARAGLILVCVNPAYRLAELEFALNAVTCRALVTAVRFKTTDYLGMLRDLAPELDRCEPGALVSERLPHLTTIIQMGEADEPGMLRFADAMVLGQAEDHAGLRARMGAIQPDDAVNIQFTSGTTGLPKAATLTHQGLLNNALFWGDIGKIVAGDRCCIPLPLYHIGALVGASVMSLVHGFTAIYPGEAFDPTAVLDTLRDERCTGFGGVPTMFVALLNHPNFARYDLSRLRGGFVGGAPCPEQVMRRIMDEMGLRDICNVYGMTETSPLSLQNRPDDPMDSRLRTVGRVHPHVEMKLVDPQGRLVPRGAQGEICVRGYLVMLGYWGNEKATRETIDQARWLRTGDLGVMDADGFVAITGRAKDMVIRGGENIYPAEIEAFLCGHPAIADAQGFGVPDEYFGEELCVWIQLRPGANMTEDELRAYCRGRITHFKIPRHIRFVDAYPMTVSGKVQKFAMRDRMIAELNARTA